MKRINYWIKCECRMDAGKLSIHQPEIDNYDRDEISEELGRLYGWMYHPATRNSHYTALNCLPVVVGTKWTISEHVYWEFLEMLPPLDLPIGFNAISGFVCREASTGSIHSAYYKSCGKYWHEYIDIATDK